MDIDHLSVGHVLQWSTIRVTYVVTWSISAPPNSLLNRDFTCRSADLNLLHSAVFSRFASSTRCHAPVIGAQHAGRCTGCGSNSTRNDSTGERDSAAYYEDRVVQSSPSSSSCSSEWFPPSSPDQTNASDRCDLWNSSTGTSKRWESFARLRFTYHAFLSFLVGCFQLSFHRFPECHRSIARWIMVDPLRGVLQLIDDTSTSDGTQIVDELFNPGEIIGETFEFDVVFRGIDGARDIVGMALMLQGFDLQRIVALLKFNGNNTYVLLVEEMNVILMDLSLMIILFFERLDQSLGFRCTLRWTTDDFHIDQRVYRRRTSTRVGSRSQGDLPVGRWGSARCSTVMMHEETARRSRNNEESTTFLVLPAMRCSSSDLVKYRLRMGDFTGKTRVDKWLRSFSMRFFTSSNFSWKHWTRRRPRRWR